MLCSNKVASPWLYYMHCIGVNPVTCGNVASLNIQATTTNQTITVQNIFRAIGQACYWNITGSFDDYEDDAVINFKFGRVANMDVYIVHGASRVKAKDSMNITSDQIVNVTLKD